MIYHIYTRKQTKSDMNISLVKINNNKTTYNNKSDNIFWNDGKWNKLLSYHEYVSSIIKPNNWYELNDQLLCPIKHSRTLYPNTFESNAQERILKKIYKQQMLDNCLDPNNRFIIFDLELIKSTGMMAGFNGKILKSFFVSFIDNRTILYKQQWSWGTTHKYCLNKNYTGFECFFLPISNCNVDDILSNTHEKDIVHIGKYDNECDTALLENETNDVEKLKIPRCKQRIIIIDKLRGWNWWPLNSQIEIMLNKFTDVHTNWNTWRSVFAGYFFRIKSPLKNIVFNNIRNSIKISLNKSYNWNIKKGINKQLLNNWNTFNIYNTFSLPIRHSDKCEQNPDNPNPESECWYENDYYNLIHTVRLFDNNIDTVILTSEDSTIIDKIVALLREKDDDIPWKIILNYNDNRPDVPIIKYAGIKHNDNENIKNDVVLGAMTSWLLQTNGKYMAHTRSSNYLDIVWGYNAASNCQLLFFSDILQVNGIQNDVNKYDKELIQYYNHKERPSFMFNPINTYNIIRKGCIELRRKGQLNMMVKGPLMTFPQQIWDEIKHRRYNGKQFETVFGIPQNGNGYNGIMNYCSRYTKPSYDMTDDHYSPKVQGFVYP